LREVGSGNDDDALSLGKTIQLNEKLVESLPKILLVFGATLATNCVQLVDKDGSGTVSYEEFIAHVFGK